MLNAAVSSQVLAPNLNLAILNFFILISLLPEVLFLLLLLNIYCYCYYYLKDAPLGLRQIFWPMKDLQK